MRILILIAIGLLLYIIIGNILRKNKLSSPKEPDSEKMVSCKHCGLHILEQEAVKSGQRFYCSQGHLEADTQAK